MLFKLAVFSTIILNLTSCSAVSTKTQPLSCNASEINCYRFSYASIYEFKNTVGRHAKKWSLSSPSSALSNIILEYEIIVNSKDSAEQLIKSHPELIFTLGKHIEAQSKPREWLFIAEQAFIRSWNNLNR
jgi:hypothetical protein